MLALTSSSACCTNMLVAPFLQVTSWFRMEIGSGWGFARSVVCASLTDLGRLSAELLHQGLRIDGQLPQQVGVPLGVDLLGQLPFGPLGHVAEALGPDALDHHLLRHHHDVAPSTNSCSRSRRAASMRQE